MTALNRRQFLELAIAFGASAAWSSSFASPSRVPWRERRDLYREGVASADPHSDSVLLWTRRELPPTARPASLDSAPKNIDKLAVEVAEDSEFARVVVTGTAPVSAASDWTTRVLVGGLKSRHIYYYRFTDAQGLGSRIGRTITAPADDKPQPTINMLLLHGVRSCLEYAKSGDIDKARALSNPDLSPHLTFIDMGGHGYTVVGATNDTFETEFVCIPRPLERSPREDGGPLAYRVCHTTQLWKKGEAPKLAVKIIEGDPRFSI